MWAKNEKKSICNALRLDMNLSEKVIAPSEDRTHDLQITLIYSDYETDALPTALLRLYSD